MLGDVNNLFVFKSLLTMPRNVLPLGLKQTFPPVIWIFTESEGDGIESRLPFEIFSTLQILPLLEVLLVLRFPYMFPYTIPKQPDQNCKYQLSYRIQCYSMLLLFCFCEVLEPQEPCIVSYFPVHFSKLLSQFDHCH